MGKEVLDKIKDGLIVSCQARKGWPMYGADIMAAFATAAKVGGAVGIRATGRENIARIKENVDLPIIGINKVFSDYPVYITPTYESAKEIAQNNAVNIKKLSIFLYLFIGIIYFRPLHLPWHQSFFLLLKE